MPKPDFLQQVLKQHGIFWFKCTPQHFVFQSSSKAKHHFEAHWQWPLQEAGPLSWVWTHQKPLLVKNLEEPKFFKFYPTLNLRREQLISIFHVNGWSQGKLWLAPLLIEKKMVGVCVIPQLQGSTEQINLLKTWLKSLDLPLAAWHEPQQPRKQIEVEASLVRNQLQALFDISQAISSARSEEHILAIVIKDITRALKFDRTILYLVNETQNTLYAKFLLEKGKIKPADFSKTLKAGNGLAIDIALAGKPRILNYSHHLPVNYLRTFKALQTKEFLMVPIFFKDKLVAMLGADNFQSQKPLTQNDLSVLTSFSQQIGIALQNSRLFNELEALVRKRTEELYTRNRDLEQAYSQLQNTQQELIHSARLSVLGELTASVIHEIKNPLQGIYGFTDLLVSKAQSSSAENRELVSALQTSVDHLQKVVLNFLSFSRKEKIRMSAVDCRHVFEIATQLTLPHLRKHQVQLITKNAEKLPLITGNESQLVQVITNMILNACQAMPRGGKITLSSMVEKEQIKLSIADTGQGIPAAKLKNLFQAFYSSAKQTNPQTLHGTGLGLSVSQRIISEHGGKISVKSKVGRGTEFVIELPVN